MKKNRFKIFWGKEMKVEIDDLREWTVDSVLKRYQAKGENIDYEASACTSCNCSNPGCSSCNHCSYCSQCSQ